MQLLGAIGRLRYDHPRYRRRCLLLSSLSRVCLSIVCMERSSSCFCPLCRMSLWSGCVFVVTGCMDSTASNYAATADLRFSVLLDLWRLVLLPSRLFADGSFLF